MEKLLARLIKIIIGLILLLILIPTIYIFWGYYKINSDFTAKEQYVVRPQVDAGSLSEAGYVLESRTVTCIKNRTKRLYWWVKIPATHKQYLCEWQYGFSGFKKDDAVTMIHKVEGTDISTDYTGYLIGLHGKIKDQASTIVTHGVEDMKD
ncbi:MAG: hypothetical protein C0407_17025 [Desulfobacca sp.]|nr:hypothetical protein [Desulfobacca sp.]